MVRIIKTVEDFWQVIDEIRVKREINWSNLVGGKAQLAASKRWNPPLTDILQMQKKLDVDIINTLVYELTEAEQEVTKDPEVPEKMKLIYQWIQAENWMEDEELLQKVQEVARTIL